MRKDSVLWLQIVVGPIEVVRGLITRDSIQIIDRHNKAYYQYDFASLSQKFNFQLSFDLIQSILVGNMPIPKKPGEKFKKENDYFMLRQNEGKISLENYIGEQNRRLKKLLVTEQPSTKILLSSIIIFFLTPVWYSWIMNQNRTNNDTKPYLG